MYAKHFPFFNEYQMSFAKAEWSVSAATPLFPGEN
jgi:hypothetical protein